MPLICLTAHYICLTAHYYIAVLWSSLKGLFVWHNCLWHICCLAEHLQMFIYIKCNRMETDSVGISREILCPCLHWIRLLGSWARCIRFQDIIHCARIVKDSDELQEPKRPERWRWVPLKIIAIRCFVLLEQASSLQEEIKMTCFILILTSRSSSFISTMCNCRIQSKYRHSSKSKQRRKTLYVETYGLYKIIKSSQYYSDIGFVQSSYCRPPRQRPGRPALRR